MAEITPRTKPVRADATELPPDSVALMEPEERQDPRRQAAVEYFQDYAAEIEARRTVDAPAFGVRLGVEAPADRLPPGAVGVGGPLPAPGPVRADQIPAPRVAYSAAGTSGQLSGAMRDIFASSEMAVIRGVTVRAASFTADANGDKLLIEGTVLAVVAASNPVKYKARTSEAAVGVCASRVNLRDGDTEVPMVTAGFLNRARCIDNGTLGYPIAGGTPETELRALGLYFRDYTP